MLLAVLLGFAVSARTDRRFGVDEGGSSGSRHLSKDLEHGGRYTEIDPPTRLSFTWILNGDTKNARLRRLANRGSTRTWLSAARRNERRLIREKASVCRGDRETPGLDDGR